MIIKINILLHKKYFDSCYNKERIYEKIKNYFNNNHFNTYCFIFGFFICSAEFCRLEQNSTKITQALEEATGLEFDLKASSLQPTGILPSGLRLKD